jgi:hypothetical protein
MWALQRMGKHSPDAHTAAAVEPLDFEPTEACPGHETQHDHRRVIDRLLLYAYAHTLQAASTYVLTLLEPLMRCMSPASGAAPAADSTELMTVDNLCTAVHIMNGGTVAREQAQVHAGVAFLVAQT